MYAYLKFIKKNWLKKKNILCEFWFNFWDFLAHSFKTEVLTAQENQHLESLG